MLQRQWNSTAGLWTWVWSPGPMGPTPCIIPVHFSDLLFPQLLLLSCRETLTFWDVWTESALCPDLALATVWSGPSQQRHAVLVLVLKKKGNKWRVRMKLKAAAGFWNLVFGDTQWHLVVAFKISGLKWFWKNMFQVRSKGIAVA